MDWKQQIEYAAAQRSGPVKAHTYRNKSWPSASRPVVLACEDGNDYVVKGRQAGRMIINEQVVGHLGRLLGAPVGDVRLVEVPKPLIDLQVAGMGHIPPGISHGSLLIPDCSNRQWISHTDEPQNRERFELLALLYGWSQANDHQLIYRQSKPHIVYSVDHGHFFPGGPNWTVETLRNAGVAKPYSPLINDAQIRQEDLRRHLPTVENITSEQIASAVAAPDESWALLIDERVALAEYLEQRRTQLVKHLNG